jgi:SNF2 family DNA or RNA helicase
MRLEVVIRDGQLVVKGDTYEFNQSLPFKEFGFRFNGNEKAWVKDAGDLTADKWRDYLYYCYIRGSWVKTYPAIRNISYRHTPRTDAPHTLRPHQIEAVERIVSAYKQGYYGFVLADAPRVGKTYATLEAVSVISDMEGGLRALVLCPASLVPMWKNNLSLYGINGDVFSYEKFRSEYERHKDNKSKDYVNPFISYDLLVLDEAHKVKNKSAKVTKCVIEMKKRKGVRMFTICLTGTPFQNNPSELKTLLDISTGNGDYVEPFMKTVADKYQGYKQVWDGSLESLRHILTNELWYLRREIKDVNELLPPIERNIIEIDQQGWFSILKEIENELVSLHEQFVQQGQYRKTEAVDRLLKGFVSIEDLGLLYGNLAKMRSLLGKAKVRFATEYIIDTIISTGEPILVFTHHNEVRDEIESALKDAGIEYDVIEGSTSKEKRQLAQERFQNGELQVLILSTRAAGEGLTLSKAARSVFVELDWNPAVLLQAEARMVDVSGLNGKIADYIIAPHPVEGFLIGTINQKAEAIQRVYNENTAFTKC